MSEYTSKSMPWASADYLRIGEYKLVYTVKRPVGDTIVYFPGGNALDLATVRQRYRNVFLPATWRTQNFS